MIKIISTYKIMKYQVIKFEKQSNNHYRWVKLSNKTYKPITVYDAENCVAIESDDDISGIEYIYFLENI